MWVLAEVKWARYEDLNERVLSRPTRGSDDEGTRPGIEEDE